MYKKIKCSLIFIYKKEKLSLQWSKTNRQTTNGMTEETPSLSVRTTKTIK
jgi:hypothetical protein